MKSLRGTSETLVWFIFGGAPKRYTVGSFEAWKFLEKRPKINRTTFEDDSLHILLG